MDHTNNRQLPRAPNKPAPTPAMNNSDKQATSTHRDVAQAITSATSPVVAMHGGLPREFTYELSEAAETFIAQKAAALQEWWEEKWGRVLSSAEMEAIATYTWANYRDQIRIARQQLRFEFVDNLMPPINETAYFNWARSIMHSLSQHSESNLPPILSYIRLPYEQPNARWSRDWLPSQIDEDSTPDWKLAVMYSLGAHIKHITERVVTLDGDDQDYEAVFETTKQRLRKKVDDWRKRKGGLFFLSNRTLSEINKSVLTGSYSRKDANAEGTMKYREPLTALQLHFNCLWDVDVNTGRMVQPFQKLLDKSCQDVDPELREDQPYGGRCYEPLFRVQQMEPQMQRWLTQANIPMPNETALRIQYPLLFQAYDRWLGTRSIVPWVPPPHGAAGLARQQDQHLGMIAGAFPMSSNTLSTPQMFNPFHGPPQAPISAIGAASHHQRGAFNKFHGARRTPQGIMGSMNPCFGYVPNSQLAGASSNRRNEFFATQMVRSEREYAGFVNDQDLQQPIPAASPATTESQGVIFGNYQGGATQGTPHGSNFVSSGNNVGGATQDEDEQDLDEGPLLTPEQVQLLLNASK